MKRLIAKGAQNQAILDAIWKAGYTSINAFCTATKTNRQVFHLVNGESPINNTTGRLRRSAVQLVEVLGVLPDDLWTASELYPREIAFDDLGVTDEHARNYVQAERVHFLSPMRYVELTQLRPLILDAMSDMPPKLREVLVLRFGLDGEEELTIEEVGKHLGYSREHVRHLEARGMCFLRHPNRSRDLRWYLEEYY